MPCTYVVSQLLDLRTGRSHTEGVDEFIQPELFASQSISFARGCALWEHGSGWRVEADKPAGKLVLSLALSLSLLLGTQACLLQVVESVQHGGQVVLSGSPADLASLSQYKNAWGLPHVLACVCCQG